MRPPDRYSASPLYSFCVVSSRAPPLAETLKALWRWWRGTRPTPRERQLEAVAVEHLLAEMEEGETKPRETKPRETKPGLRQN
jgi:hypothetical protein